MIGVRVLFVLLAVALAGCGGDQRAAEGRSPATGSTASRAPASPAAASGATEAGPSNAAPATGPTGAAATPDAPEPDAPRTSDANPGGASAEEAGEGGAGDETPIRQRARFTVGAAGLRPASVSVAPFLAIALTVVNVDEAVHRIRVIGVDVAFDVLPGQTEQRTVAGLPAGRYTVSVDGGASAGSLTVGDQAGP